MPTSGPVLIFLSRRTKNKTKKSDGTLASLLHRKGTSRLKRLESLGRWGRKEGEQGQPCQSFASSPEGGNGNTSGRSPGFRIIPLSSGLPGVITSFSRQPLRRLRSQSITPVTTAQSTSADFSANITHGPSRPSPGGKAVPGHSGGARAGLGASACERSLLGHTHSSASSPASLFRSPGIQGVSAPIQIKRVKTSRTTEDT